MVVLADVSGQGLDDYAHLIWIGTENSKGHRADTVKSYHDPDSSDPAFLKEVLNDVNRLFPADVMGMCVLSHASGWLPTDLFGKPSRSLIDDNGSYMELTDFADTIPYKLDYLIFDPCFMAGIEVAYELKDKADYIIASPAEVVVPGFDYSKMMGRLFKSSLTEADLAGVAKDFYTMFANGVYPNPDYNAATVSVVKTSELDALAEYVRQYDLLPWLQTEPYLGAVQNYHPTRYYYSDMEDLVRKMYGEGSAEAEGFAKFFYKAVIDKYNTDHYYSDYNKAANKIDYFSGLTVYIPRAAYTNLNEYYKNLKWYRDVYPEE
ncbi:MAG: clostripain-related cysteine peptidase [Alistipes sp.]|nr:clostripain-related cysteine peptidase [Alistipes sp.]